MNPWPDVAPHDPGARLVWQLLETYCTGGSDTAVGALVDQIGAHLAADTAVRAGVMVGTANGYAATLLRVQAATKGRFGDRWNVLIAPGLHRRCPAAYDIAGLALNAALNGDCSQAVIGAWCEAGRDATVDLVVESVWLARLVLGDVSAGRAR